MININFINFQKISEKQIQINGLDINYKTIGDGKIPIVLLHGWGMASDKYLELIGYLSQFSIFNFQFSIIVPDLPGFGKSEEPKEDWIVDDYVEFADKFIETVTRGRKGFELIKSILEKFDPKKAVYTEEKNKMILIGHSFGGMIAIKYAGKYPEKIDKLILTGAAGIKHKLTVKQGLFSILTKTGKTMFALPVINNFQKPVYKIFSKIARQRKKDYYFATSRMKKIMKNVLKEDLINDLDKIKTPTLLVWGREDKTTPLADGEIIKSKIPNSELVIIDDANHSLSCQKAEEFGEAINSTLTNTD